LRGEHTLRQSSAMRVALVHYTYAPVLGGVERVMAAHARLFASAGHEVTIVCREGASDHPAITIAHLPGDPSLLRQFLETTLAPNDVVFMHNVCTMPFDPALTRALWEIAGTLPRTRFICWIHDLALVNQDRRTGSENDDGKMGIVHPRFEYVAVSEYRARQFAEITGVRAQVVPNGIDIAQALALDKELAEIATAHRLSERDIVLLQPARLVARKRVEFSLQILRALRDAAVDAALLVTAAPDPHNAALAQLRASLHQSRVGLESHAIFLNEVIEVTDPRLAQLYRIADALLIPSRDEGFALPLLEAALHRLPVFCTDLEPLREYDWPLHTFSPDEDPGVIAQMISRTLLKSPTTQARKRAACDFAWDTIFRHHLAPMLLGATNQNSP